MKSTLVVIFNQDYSKNIPKLERIYGDRFARVEYLVPDHSSYLHRLYSNKAVPVFIPFWLDAACSFVRRSFGRRNAHELELAKESLLHRRIFRVIGHQFYFYHFVVQAADRLLASDSDWYWLAGDDAIINPALNEAAMERKFGLCRESGPDLVMCRPVISRDDWIAHIEGSVRGASERLLSAIGNPEVWCDRFSIRRETGANANKHVPVACVDFIGLSRGLLERSISVLRSCFREKLYVELGFPNAVLSACSRPVFVDDYVWERSVGAEKVVEMVEQLRGNPETIFAHPIKLSALDGAMIDLMAG